MRPLPLPQPALRDEAVALRPWREDDVPAIVEACRDPLVPRWTFVPSPYTEEHARAFVAAAEPQRLAGEALDLAIAAAADDRMLGAVGLLRPTGPSIEVGYWTAPGARGRGVATRAVRLLTGWALRTLEVERVELLPFAGNRASMRVAVKAGFADTGERRAHARGALHVYALSRPAARTP